MDVQDGGPWRDLPECYGKWITVYQRFNRWSGDGAMERLSAALQEERIIAVEVRVPAMDSTSVKVHQHAVVPPKRNRTDPWDYDRQAYKGRNMVEHVFDRMKHHRKATTRYDRLDAIFLANPQPILIAIQLKKQLA